MKQNISSTKAQESRKERARQAGGKGGGKQGNTGIHVCIQALQVKAKYVKSLPKYIWDGLLLSWRNAHCRLRSPWASN